jgi:uncharacterized protein (TIGR03083 family)
MGMNEEHRTPPPTTSLDDLAVYALDAHETDDETAIESHLLASPEAARWERALRDAAGELAAGSDEVTPSPHLRQRVLAAAFHRRTPGSDDDGRDAGGAVEVHRIELRRALELLDGLAADDWELSLGPPEFAGWTVHDLVVHLAANESLLAARLDVPLAGTPETSGDNDARTAAARTRHQGRPPAEALGELRAAGDAVDRRATSLDDDALDAMIDWWGLTTRVRTALLVRAFETWTHADDVRRALGLPALPPPPASLRTMSATACGLVPLMLAVADVHRPGRVVRFTFTDLGGASFDVALDEFGQAGPADAAPGQVDAAIEVDAISFCRCVANRLPPTELAYRSTGDAVLAREVIDATPTLAVL